jgi:hypothetical protein
MVRVKMLQQRKMRVTAACHRREDKGGNEIRRLKSSLLNLKLDEP